MSKYIKNAKHDRLLSDVVAYRTYAKQLHHLGRRESLEETINRNMNMHLDMFPKLSSDIVKAYQRVHNLQVMPSMRAMQFSGEAIMKNPIRQYNCSFANIDDPKVFSEALYLLLSGVGFGYSVQNRHISKLPKITTPKERGYFVVQDSIMGWAQALEMLMSAYFNGSILPEYDFGNVRPKGSYLVTTGAKAPGPEPLKKMLTQVEEILKKAIGRQMTSLECHDLTCIISDSVLAGGIRRAALIVLFDRNDEAMLKCKHGEWWNTAPWRARANNSAILPRNKVTQEEFNYIYEMCQKSGSGEPGFYWTDNEDWGSNPCVEIALQSNQFCVTGDTKLITKDGIVNIGDSVGKEISVWNGDKWSKTTPVKTQTNVDIYRVNFSDGSYLDCTGNHRFIVKKLNNNEYKELTTLEIESNILSSRGYNRNKFSLPGVSILQSNQGKQEDNAYEYGYFKGDGHVSHSSDMPSAMIYDEKDLKLNLNYKVIGKSLKNSYGTSCIQVSFNQLDRNFCKQLKHGLPDQIFEWNRESVLNFVAGWADADGSNASRGIRIYGNESSIRQGQLLLTKVGVRSSVNLMSKAGTITNLGIRKNDVWYLQITKTNEIPSRRLNCSNTSENKFKGINQKIESIVKLDKRQDSFCLEEKQLHQCVFNNVLTKQCNLTTINQTGITSERDFLNRVYAATLIGTLQASYTDFDYLRPIWRKTTEAEALLGVSFTGIADGMGNPLITAELLQKGVKHALEVNEKYAKKIGINLAARLTAIKPEGTSSCVLGSSSGVHARHADHYLRRIRMNSDDSLTTYLKSVVPDLVEPDLFSATGVVVTIPQESPPGSLTRHNETAESLLNRALFYRENWIEPGHRSGDNKHNVSVTISVKDNEWDSLKELMWQNRDRYSGISLLPFDGGTYKQAPFEDCTKERYDELSKLVVDIDLRQVREENDTTSRIEVLACAGGTCVID